MSNLRVPRSPIPLYWRDEQTGKMADAVAAYLNDCCDNTTTITEDQLALVIDYCDAWISADVWHGPGIVGLRKRIKGVKTFKQLHKWLHDALDVGIDPL